MIKQTSKGQIMVCQPSTNQAFPLLVDLDVIVSDLMQELECQSEGQNFFTFKGRLLDPIKSLKQNGIEFEDTVNLMTVVFGGGGIKTFKFSNMRNKQELSFRDDGLGWMIINYGLNLLGKCKSQECQAFQQSVACQIGLGKFSMAEQYCKFKCPMCKKKGKTDGGCLLWNCEYDIIGLEVDQEDEFEVLNQIAPKEKATYYKGDDDASQAQWQYLNIETRSLNKKHKI